MEVMFAYNNDKHFELDFLIVPSKDLKWFNVRNSKEIWDNDIINKEMNWKEYFISVGDLRIGIFAWFATPVDEFFEMRVFSYLENLVRPMFSGGSQYADQSLKRIN